MKKILAMCSVAVLCLASLAGCGSAKSGDTSAIKIGGSGPLTGEYAIYGNAAKQGAEIAVEEINKAEGTTFFELKYEDDQGDPELAVNAYNKLKDSGMKISLGGVTSGACAAFAAEANKDKIFTLTPSASSPTVNEGYDNIFQMCFSDPNQGVASADYISTKFAGAKVGVIYQNDLDYSKGIYDKFAAEAKVKNIEVVSVQTFTKDSQNDFKTQINNLKAAGADLVFLPIYYTPASLILNQAKNQCDYAPANGYFGVDGMDGILTLENFDTSLAEGVMLLTPFSADATDTKTANFVSQYKEKYNEVPNQFAADAYDAIYALYNAVKGGKVTADMSLDDINAALISQFTSMKFDGITGTGTTWNSNGYVSKEPKAVVIKNGAYVGM